MSSNRLSLLNAEYLSTKLILVFRYVNYNAYYFWRLWGPYPIRTGFLKFESILYTVIRMIYDYKEVRVPLNVPAE